PLPTGAVSWLYRALPTTEIFTRSLHDALPIYLDYTSKVLYEPMKNEMLYWVKEHNIDGFRCDVADNVPTEFWQFAVPKLKEVKPDRKSTRLNSSHVKISYAVFCLKKTTH